MPGSTTTYGLPYQTLSDPPHGPNLGQDLAEAVEDELVRIDAAAAALDTRLDTLEALARCRAYATAVASCTNNTLTLVPLGGESYDSATMHSTVSTTSRVSAPTNGCYNVLAQVSWAANATGRRVITIRKNAAGASGGGTQVAQVGIAASPASGTGVVAATDLMLNAGDYLEIFALQSSGGALDASSGEDSTFLSLRLVDPT